MTICERIEFDVQSLEGYFRRLFAIASEATPSTLSSLAPADEPQSFVPHDFTIFIRPDMVCNVYSLVDFWLPQLSDFHARKLSLPLTYKDIKGTSDLDAYHKYFTKVASLQLDTSIASFNYLDNLWKIRNRLIHGGGHVPPPQHAEIERIPGITLLFGSLIKIDDSFIWDSLRHAKVYLCAVGQA
jgi:hypothetical protein